MCDAARPPPLSALAVLQLCDDSPRTSGLTEGAKQKTAGKTGALQRGHRVCSQANVVGGQAGGAADKRCRELSIISLAALLHHFTGSLRLVVVISIADVNPPQRYVTTPLQPEHIPEHDGKVRGDKPTTHATVKPLTRS